MSFVVIILVIALIAGLLLYQYPLTRYAKSTEKAEDTESVAVREEEIVIEKGNEWVENVQMAIDYI